VQVTGLLQQNGRISGVRAVDRLGGRSFEVLGRLVINTAGPWVNRVLGLGKGRRLALHVPLSKTINIITRTLTNGHSLSVILPRRRNVEAPGDDAGNRRIYITPWRGQAIVGSAHRVFTGEPEACRATEAEIAALVTDINTAYPGAALRLEDVMFIHVGLLPCEERDGEAMPASLARHYRICDHKQEHGVDGLVSVVGIKYTTARDVAQKTVNLALRKLGKNPVPSRSAKIQLCGGAIGDFSTFLAQALHDRPHGLGADILQQLVHNYGSDYGQVLRYFDVNPAWKERVVSHSAVIKAQIVHAVREEMAYTLQDVVFRRAELGTLDHPGSGALCICAELMAEELGWDTLRVERELEETEQVFVRHGARPIEALVGHG
jgi:glycerol-3-phosphate dehydrogenase